MNAGRPSSVLLVEDDAAQAELVREVLAGSRPPGFVVRHVTSADAAVEALHAGLFEIVLLDAVAPNRGVFDGLRAIRGIAPDAAIVLQSATADERLALEALELGADDFILRPDAGHDHGLERSIRYAIARRTAEDSRRRLAAIVASTDEAIVSRDVNGVITSWNAGAERLYGYTAREAIGQTLDDRILPERAAEQRQVLDRVLGGHRVHRYETRRKRRDGQVVDVGLTISPILDATGRVVGASAIGRDISDRKRAESQFRGLLESAGDAMVIVDQSGRIVLANKQAEPLFGYTRAELLSLSVEALIPTRSAGSHQSHRTAFSEDPRARPMGAGYELRALRKDGSEVPVEISLGPLETEDGTLVSAAIRDVTERKLAEQALREAEERFRRAFDEAPIGMAILDLDGRFQQVNEALSEITGYSRAQLTATTTQLITHPDDLTADEPIGSPLLADPDGRHGSEKRFIHANGQPVWVVVHTAVLRDRTGAPVNLLAQIQDVTDRRRYEEQLRHQADHDPLTGFLNRSAFERALEAHRARRSRYGGAGAVLVLDLDQFKFINDTLGHTAGDEAIARAANALSSRLRETDVLARLGGDEFAVLLPDAGAVDARLVAEQLLDTLREQTVALKGRSRTLAASVGISLFESEGELTGEDVLVNADLAMYDAKNNGRDRAELYQIGDEQSSRMKGRVTWAQRIGSALASNGFTLLAQPIIDFSTGRVTQHELLLRMNADDHELVPPASFLYVAERLGMVQEIDRWVTQQAINILDRHHRAGHDLTLEVNLSGLSIGDRELLLLIAHELDRTGVPPRQLVFEVTETAAVTNMARASQFVRELAQLGCRFALDDFGAGYGSFYYLKHLPFDFLKIDGEFVRRCLSNQTDRLIIKAAVDIATGLGKKTIAEYVGDDQTVALLTRLGVDYGQGHHLGSPAPLDSLSATAALPISTRLASS